MSVKTDRIASNIVKEISYVLMMEAKNPDLKFVTITDCHLAPDLSYAKVYYTTMNDDKKEVFKDLNDAAGFIRKELADRIDIRHIPELEFVYDESIEYGKKIENIIEQIHEDDK